MARHRYISAWSALLVSASLTGCEATVSPPVQPVVQQTRKPQTVRIDERDVAAVLRMADSIVVIDCSESESSLVGKAIEDPIVCHSLAGSIGTLDFLDFTGEGLASSDWIHFRVVKSGNPLAEYTLFTMRSLTYHDAGRNYLAELGNEDFYERLHWGLTRLDDAPSREFGIHEAAQP